MNQVLNENERLLEQVINKYIVNIIMNSSMDIASINMHECEKCLKLETELLNKKDFVEKEIYDKLFSSFTTLKKHCISLEVDSQINQEIFQRDNSVSNQNAPSFDQLFELNELKAQSQEKDTVIKKFKERIKSLSGKMNEDKIKKDLEDIETINIEFDHRVSKLIDENKHLKQTYKHLYDSIKPVALKDDLRKLKGKDLVDNNVTKHPSNPKMLKIDVEPITPKLLNKKTAHSAYIKHTQEKATSGRNYRNTKKDKIRQTPSSTQKNKVEAHPRKVKSSLKNKDCVVESKGTAHVQHSRLNANSELKCVKCNGCMLSANHDLCVLDFINNVNAVIRIVLWYLDSGCSKHMTGDRSQGSPIRFNIVLEGVDLLTGSRGKNLYTLSLGDMMASSPICLLSKASKTKSWLWQQRLSHLNFGAINHLARHGLVRGLPKLKFEKDHLCSTCAMGKSKKKPHKPKSEDTNQEKLYLLYMDLCGPMRVASVNGKKYILVIVDDYSRFTWVKFLRTDNGTVFVNQTLREYYEKIGFSHETSVARSPQQNGVVERLATACYTQNHSIIHLRHGKTPYELLYDKPPDLSFFHVFGALCYPTNDSENLGKLQPKADIGIFIGYAPTKKAFRIYNRRTRRIIETIHVDFDELTAMASEHSSLGPTLHEITPATIS
ncbi:retrovirus-related pol polyprotein from transposon TNT 1-94 [Tanacetum coccineum]